MKLFKPFLYVILLLGLTLSIVSDAQGRELIGGAFVDIGAQSIARDIGEHYDSSNSINPMKIAINEKNGRAFFRKLFSTLFLL